MDETRLPLWNYTDDAIPAWCGMDHRDHHDGLGGCWGISHGLVAERGRAYCEGCDHCTDPAGGHANRGEGEG